MSAVEVGAAPRTRSMSTRFLRSELRLIFLRRRNLAGLGVLAGVRVLIAVAVRLSSPGRDSGGPDFFSWITENGLFVSLASLTLELGLFLPLAVAAISGDSIAGEANIGTLRYLLTVPVSRTRLLAVKYAAIVVFAFAATLTVSVTGMVMGLLLFGGGDLSLLSGSCSRRPLHAIVLSLPTVRSSITHSASRQASCRSETNAVPGCSALIANAALCSAM